MSSQSDEPTHRIAESTVRRLSTYLRFLEEFANRGYSQVSSEELAQRGGTMSGQVRKDLSLVAAFGTRGHGYSISELSKSLRAILGIGRARRVVIVGAGSIAVALTQYSGFLDKSFAILAVYDSDPHKIGRRLEGIEIRDIARFEELAAFEEPEIAVIAIPGEDAQRMMDLIVRSGIKAVLNFAPAKLRAPQGVVVRDVNMAIELEALSFALRYSD